MTLMKKNAWVSSCLFAPRVFNPLSFAVASLLATSAASAGLTVDSVSFSPVVLDLGHPSASVVLSGWSTPDGAFETSVADMSFVGNSAGIGMHMGWAYDAHLFFDHTGFTRSLGFSATIAFTVTDSFEFGNGYFGFLGPTGAVSFALDGPSGRTWLSSQHPITLGSGQYWLSANGGWSSSLDLAEGPAQWVDFSWRASFDFDSHMAPAPGALGVSAVAGMVLAARRRVR